MSTSYVPFLRAPFGNKERAAAYRVMSGNQISVGPETSIFEQQFKEYIGANSAVSVGNGTLALELVWQTFIQQGKLNVGDKVLVPSFTFVAVANSIVRSGLVPVFCDIDSETWNIELIDDFEPEWEAVCAVHNFGNPCNIDELQEQCRYKDFLLIEDCAEACGATYQGKRVGSFGDASIFSFSATKNMTTGEGGMTCFKDQEDADTALLLKENGFGYGNRNAQVAGHNYRLSNIQCAIGIEQLKTLNGRNKRRVKNAYQFYRMCLEYDLPLTPQMSNTDCDSVYQILGLTLPPCINRDAVVERLNKKGIECKKYFSPNVHSQFYYKNTFRNVCLPHTEDISNRIICVPHDDKISEEEQYYIISSLKEVI